MRYETFMFIINNKKRFLYDNATGAGSDNTTDPTAKSVNPNDYLPPIIGGSPFIKALVVIALILTIVHLLKNTVQ